MYEFHCTDVAKAISQPNYNTIVNPFIHNVCPVAEPEVNEFLDSDVYICKLPSTARDILNDVPTQPWYNMYLSRPAVSSVQLVTKSNVGLLLSNLAHQRPNFHASTRFFPSEQIFTINNAEGVILGEVVEAAKVHVKNMDEPFMIVVGSRLVTENTASIFRNTLELYQLREEVYLYRRVRTRA